MRLLGLLLLLHERSTAERVSWHLSEVHSSERRSHLLRLVGDSSLLLLGLGRLVLGSHLRSLSSRSHHLVLLRSSGSHHISHHVSHHIILSTSGSHHLVLLSSSGSHHIGSHRSEWLVHGGLLLLLLLRLRLGGLRLRLSLGRLRLSLISRAH